MSKTIMKTVFHFSAVVALALLCACGKNQTEAERNAEIERKVQERLATERQTQDQQRLTQAQVDLDQRLKDLETRNNATPAPARETQAEPERERAPRPSGPREAADAPTASYSTFYTRLEPQGVWRETSNYGYVWQPRIAQESRDWRPYTHGRWVYTDAGWTWISEEPFGWATYHYGRWTRLHGIGWVWVPGDEWAPAWVSWRTSNEYVGWAPLPPEARFDRGTGIHNWADNYYDIGPDQYSFVLTNQLGELRVESAVVPIERNVTIINQTTNVTNITYSNTIIVNHGPNYDEMRTRSHQPIERFRLERQINVNFDSGDPRPVVRGEVVQMPGPVIARAQPIDRPRNVRETVTQAVVDHGWERMGDRQAAEKVRMKMKSEATPPPNAPSRTFVKPVEATTLPATALPAVTATPVPAAMATATPGRIVTPPPIRREPPVRIRPEASPSATVSVAPLATPPVIATPRLTPIATPFPTAPVMSSPTPRATRTMTPVSPRQRGIPIPSATVPAEASNAAPAAPANAATAPSTRFGHGGEAKEQRKAEKQLRRQEETAGQPHEALPQSTLVPQSSPLQSVAPASSPAAAVAESPFLSRREQRKEERKAQRAGQREGDENPSPAPSTAPQ